MVPKVAVLARRVVDCSAKNGQGVSPTGSEAVFFARERPVLAVRELPPIGTSASCPTWISWRTTYRLGCNWLGTARKAKNTARLFFEPGGMLFDRLFSSARTLTVAVGNHPKGVWRRCRRQSSGSIHVVSGSAELAFVVQTLFV